MPHTGMSAHEDSESRMSARGATRITDIAKRNNYGKEQQRRTARHPADNGGLLAEPVGGAGSAEGLSVPVNREAA